MSNKQYKNRYLKKTSTRARRARMRKVSMAAKLARFQIDYQEDKGNGPKPKLNQAPDQSIENLVGYNLGCCSSTSRSLKAYFCSNCLLWFHSACISHLQSTSDSDDKEAIRNNQWFCSKCKEKEIVEQNEDEMDKKLFIEPQNKEKLMALKLIHDLKLMNKAIEMKLEEISKWVQNKFGTGADIIPEEIGTGDQQDFEYSNLLKEECQSLSKIPVIKLKRISLIGNKRSGKTEFTKKNRSLKIKERSHLEKQKKSREKEREGKKLPMGSFLEKFKMRDKKESNNNVHSYSSKKNIPRIFKCPHENCEITTVGRSRSNLDRHIKLVHDKIKNVICHYCGKKFGEKYYLKSHIKYVHEKMKRPGQNVMCHYCGKVLVDAQHALRHIKRIHEQGTERFECPEDNCSKGFATKGALIRHKLTHCEPAEYIKCTEEGCLKRFKTKKSLKYHLEIHAAKGVRNFACTICDKTFMTRNCLSAHKRMSHAKEVNHEFKCTFEGCDVGYSIRKYLEEHLKTHEPNYQPLPKQKLIICQFCAKEYETFFQLNRHILNVHEK